VDGLEEVQSHAWSTIAASPDLIESVAQRAAELVAERFKAGYEPWLDVKDAATHIACPVSRIYALVSAGRIPHRHDGSRLLFRREQLDAWIEQGGGRRP
jgi:excisionase family DNA binding protein